MEGDSRGSYLPLAQRLETGRLMLNLLEPADAPSYAAMIAERGPGARGYGTTIEEAVGNILLLADSFRRNGFGLLAIRDRSSGLFVGYCGLIVGRATEDKPEIAFELLRQFHGHGYATESAQAVVEAAAATGRARLWSTVGALNSASLRVLEKNGFRRDHVESAENRGDVIYLVRDLSPARSVPTLPGSTCADYFGTGNQQPERGRLRLRRGGGRVFLGRSAKGRRPRGWRPGHRRRRAGLRRSGPRRR